MVSNDSTANVFFYFYVNQKQTEILFAWNVFQVQIFIYLPTDQ